ncbi:MAG: hypothetical protein VYC04_01790, partial [Actinomycetota bacterium]|nr:hypothetical protein [Actinomycetota bacterium]
CHVSAALRNPPKQNINNSNSSFAVAEGRIANTVTSNQTLIIEIGKWMLPSQKPEKTSAPARNRHPK